MAKSIKAEDLEKSLSDYFNYYREEIQEDVVEATDQITKEAKNMLKATSPRDKDKSRKNPYYRGWATKVQKKGKYRYTKVVWNKTNYQLTHLLEFGHRKRNGTGWVDAQPHIQKVEEKYKVEFIDLLNQKIRSTK